MDSLTVTVSQQTLDEFESVPVAERGDDRAPFHCPIQRSIRYALGERARWLEVTVWRDKARIRSARYDELLVNPEWVRKWIDKWDSGKPVRPISFTYGHSGALGPCGRRMGPPEAEAKRTRGPNASR